MKILLVEDDENLNHTIAFFLEREGYQVNTCSNGEDALFYCQESAPDLILLDRMLPGLNGMELLKNLRETNNFTPVLFLTALGTLAEKVEGLDAGADDYLVKPFEMEELLARVRSLTRRSAPGNLSGSGEPVLNCGDLYLTPKLRELKGPAGSLTLSGRESSLMELFMNHFDQTLSRGQIYLKIWGPDSEVEDGNLDNYIFFLRRRLKSLSSIIVISTVRGIGYRMTKG